MILCGFCDFLACFLLLLFFAFLSHSLMFTTSSTMEDDYRVVDWPEFKPKNKTWKGALEINEFKSESTIEFMLWWKETLIWLSTQNLIHHLFLNKVPTGEPVLTKFEEELEEVPEKFIFVLFSVFVFCFCFCFCLFTPILLFVQQLHSIFFYCSYSLTPFACLSVCF